MNEEREAPVIDLQMIRGGGAEPNGETRPCDPGFIAHLEELDKHKIQLMVQLARVQWEIENLEAKKPELIQTLNALRANASQVLKQAADASGVRMDMGQSWALDRDIGKWVRVR